MELYQLKAFVVVAEEGHLTRAAERLHASQPTVSAHIKALERELDTVLFIRTPKGMQLTEAGTRLKAGAARVLASADELRLEARSLGDRLTGTVRIGLNTDADFLRVVPLVSSMGDVYPGIILQLGQSSSTPAQEDIRAGKLDCGFIFGTPRHADLLGVRLASTQFYVAVPEVWKEHIGGGLEALARLPWINEPIVCPVQLLFDKFFASQGVKPATVLEVDGDEVIRVLVAAGKGLSFLRKDEIEAASRIGRPVHAVPFDGLCIELYFVLLKRREQDPVMRAVLNQVRSVWGLTAAPGAPPER
ncbi:MAG: LysR family transcriptional regulator [Desulfovibrionaceae bacterium]